MQKRHFLILFTLYGLNTKASNFEGNFNYQSGPRETCRERVLIEQITGQNWSLKMYVGNKYSLENIQLGSIKTDWNFRNTTKTKSWLLAEELITVKQIKSFFFPFYRSYFARKITFSKNENNKYLKIESSDSIRHFSTPKSIVCQYSEIQ